jgi:hypothetical protein
MSALAEQAPARARRQSNRLEPQVAEALLKALEPEFEVLRGAQLADFGEIAIMTVAGTVLFAALFFTNHLVIPSNWDTDPYAAWSYFLDVLLVPPVITFVVISISTRARDTNIVVTTLSRARAADTDSVWRPRSTAPYAFSWCILVIVVESIIVLVQVVVWFPINYVFIDTLCAQTPQCSDCGATPCAGTLAGGARWQFLVALLCRFFIVLVVGFYLFYLQNISQLHSASNHIMLPLDPDSEAGQVVQDKVTNNPQLRLALR